MSVYNLFSVTSTNCCISYVCSISFLFQLPILTMHFSTHFLFVAVVIGRGLLCVYTFLYKLLGYQHTVLFYFVFGIQSFSIYNLTLPTIQWGTLISFLCLCTLRRVLCCSLYKFNFLDCSSMFPLTFCEEISCNMVSFK